MSIDYSKVTGLNDHIGNIVQITDASGRVLWALAADESFDGTFKVSKITSNTYAGSTTYYSEKFVLFDVYPKTNGTVSITYEGLTKTITDTSGAAEPNAQQVFFGEFNGVADEVETPASGIVTITGACRGVAIGTYKTYSNSKTTTNYCSCIDAVGDLSGFEIIPNYAFRACANIKSVSLPETITSIGTYAFYNCTRLKSVSSFNNVTSIGQYAFYGCSALNDFDIPSKVTSIGAYAFYGCSALNSIVIPNGVIEIMYNTFQQCKKLASVVVPNSVTGIGTYAFSYCENLTSINLPDTVKTIGENAFAYCKSLESFKMPASVSVVDQWTFANCSKLKSVTLTDNVKTIARAAFEGCVSLSNFVIPASVTGMGGNPWANCPVNNFISVASGNKNFYIANNCLVRILSSGSHAVWAGFANSTIPTDVVEIYEEAFDGCTALTSITVPESITTIGDSSFYLDEGNSRTVTMLSTTPATLGASAFDKIGTNNIIVPAGCGETYKAAEGWADYAEYITEAS